MRQGTLRLRLVVYAILGFVAIQVAGVVGFMATMGESPLEAYYRTVVLVSTVGLDSLPEGRGATILSIVIIACGAVLLLCVVGLVVEATVSGIVSGAWLERGERKALQRVTDHYVICGYGRVGRRVADEFREAGVPYVVVEQDPAVVAAARQHGHLVVAGSATEDEALERAGILRARGLVACLDTDAENLYVVLSARGLRADLLIVARASGADAVAKLQRGGADRVVTPYDIAGRELATMVLRPQVSAFLEIVTGSGAAEFRFEQIEIAPGSDRIGKTLRELQLGEETGALVVAHRPPGGSFSTRPDPDAPLCEGDVLIAVGTPDELRSFDELVRREAVPS